MVAASEIQPQAQSGKSPNSKEASPSKIAEPRYRANFYLFHHRFYCYLLSLEDQKLEAATVLANGKRNLLVSDVPLAVSSLGEACELFTKVTDISARVFSILIFGRCMARLQLNVPKRTFTTARLSSRWPDSRVESLATLWMAVSAPLSWRHDRFFRKLGRVLVSRLACCVGCPAYCVGCPAHLMLQFPMRKIVLRIHRWRTRRK
jgi:hypothetical protein